MLLREATSETYGPRVYYHHINLHHFIYLFCLYLFTLHLYNKNTKNIYLIIYQISLLQVAVKGLTTPLSRWLRGSYLFV